MKRSFHLNEIFLSTYIDFDATILPKRFEQIAIISLKPVFSSFSKVSA